MSSDGIWQDPVDWVVRLNDKLVALDIQYHGIKQIQRMRFDPDETENPELINGDPRTNATMTAAAALGAVVAALKELPNFQGNMGLTALSDIGIAMADLQQGLRPSLLQPKAGSPTSGDSLGRRLIKAHVVLCVELLELAGVNNSRARRDIAAIFSRHGFKGRKSGPLSAASIYEWQNNAAQQGPDMETRSIIFRGIETWKANRSWPPHASEVLTYAEQCAADPSLQTKI